MAIDTASYIYGISSSANDVPNKPEKETPYSRFIKNLGITSHHLIKSGYHYWYLGSMPTPCGEFSADYSASGRGNTTIKLKSLLYENKAQLGEELVSTLENTPVPETLSRKNLVNVIIPGVKIELNPLDMSDKNLHILIDIVKHTDDKFQWLPILQDIVWIRKKWKKEPVKVVKKTAKKKPLLAHRPPRTPEEAEAQLNELLGRREQRRRQFAEDEIRIRPNNPWIAEQNPWDRIIIGDGIVGGNVQNEIINAAVNVAFNVGEGEDRLQF